MPFKYPNDDFLAGLGAWGAFLIGIGGIAAWLAEVANVAV